MLAFDGSTLMLPDSAAIASDFSTTGFGKNADNQKSMSRISLIYDVFNLLTLDARFDTFKTHETTLLKTQFAPTEFMQNDLLLLDRGYLSAGLLYELKERKMEFCVRLKDNWWNAVHTMLQAGETAKIVTLELSKKKPSTSLQIQFQRHFGDSKDSSSSVRKRKKEILCTRFYAQKKLLWKT